MINYEKNLIQFNINDFLIAFPYKPYDIQVDIITTIIKSLKSKENCIIESPTGTGKCLSALAAVFGYKRKIMKNINYIQEQTFKKNYLEILEILDEIIKEYEKILKKYKKFNKEKKIKKKLEELKLEIKETEEKVKEKLQEHEAKNRALVLEMLDDLPDSEIKPPENVLFICKLNPVTQDDDLEIIFGRYGPIKSCRIIRDFKTGESLKYAFIEYEKVEDCTQAYFKMDGVIIDERRIKVDFSQSVAKLWTNIKKNEGKNPQDLEKKNLEIINENKKYQIIPHKNFMSEKLNYGLLLDEVKDNYSDIKLISKEKKTNDYKDKYNKKEKELKHHKSHHHRKRSRSRSRSWKK